MLTDREIQRTKRQETARRLSDGQGLALVIEPDGRRWWRWDYRYAGKPRTLRFGAYDDVSLAQARELRRAARAQLQAGLDPSLERKRVRRLRAGQAEQTFERLAVEWLARQKTTYADATYLRVSTALEKHAYPAIGPRSVTSIEPPDILEMLQRIERRGRHETTHRVKQVVGQIFRYAIVTGRAKRDPTADLRGALLPVRVTHYAAVTEPAAIGALMRAIAGFDGTPTVAAALKLAPFVFVRPGNLRSMEWTELHLDDAEPVWRIPSAKMKMRLDHIVPLARQAVEILAPLRPRAAASAFVFPSARTRTRPMSDMALNGALRRLGYATDEMTAHGFRAMASTRLHELGWPPDVIERQLAHRDRSQTRAAYHRSLYLDERRRMMQAWADYLDELRDEGRSHK